MDNQNEEDSIIDVGGEEENTSESAEDTGFEEEEELPEEETITLPKKKFTSMQRKAMGYDALKSKKLPTKGGSYDEEVVQTVRKLEVAEQKRQFGFENNLSPQETDMIFKFTNGKPTKEVLDNPFVKSGLEGLRATKRIESNTPSSNSRSPIFQGKKFEDLDPSELKKSYEEAGKKFQVI
jgi:hypothetical protein